MGIFGNKNNNQAQASPPPPPPSQNYPINSGPSSFNNGGGTQRRRGLFSRSRSPTSDAGVNQGYNTGGPGTNAPMANGRSSMDNDYNNGNTKRTSSGGGFFRRGRSASPNNSPDNTSMNSASGPNGGQNNANVGGQGRTGVLHRNNGGSTGYENDPSITAARGKVSDAEAAEREADKALLMARNAVKEAREQVLILEREAEEEARHARAKQQEARNVSKSAKGLGRHG